MNKRSRKLLTWCLVVCMIMTNMLFANVAFAATHKEVGADRYQTALEIVKAGWTKSDSAVIATGENLADALAAAPLAYAKGKAPILLTEPGKLPAGVLAELTALGVKNVFIVGGTGAVSEAVAAELAAFTVKRISGADRYATALAIAKEAFPTAPAKAVIVNGYAVADALSISSIAANLGMPILLVDKDTKSADVATYLTGMTVYAVGGEGVISAANAGTATRLAGADRYATNVAVLKAFTLNYADVFVAVGEDANAVDALGGAAFAALGNNPIFLVGGSLTADASALLKANLTTASDVYVLGGVVPAGVVSALEALVPVDTTLKVESVSANNLIEVNVLFNKAVDEDLVEDETLYTIDGITIDSATLQADGKIVKLVLNDGTLLTNSEEYTLVVNDDIVDVSVDFTVVDASLPVAESVKLTGPNTFDINFSEPIDSNSTIVVDIEDGVYSAVAVADDTNVVEVTLGASSLNAGAYKVVVTGAEDFAGHTGLKKTFTLNYVKDTAAPAPKLVSADETEVVIDFGKVVTDENGDPLDETYFYHSYTSYQPANPVSWDGSEVTLDFSAFPLPEGTVKIVVDYDANDLVITDLWGNEMTANAVLTAAIVSDNAKPTITKTEVVDETTVDIYFSEGVTQADAETEANYVVKQDGDKIDETFVATYDTDENMVELVFSAELDGAYTVDVSDITDDAYVPNTIADVTVAFTVKDVTGIDLTAVDVEAVDGTTSDTLIVRFPDDMIGTGTYSALAKANYLVSYDGGTTFDELDAKDTVAFFNGNDTVKITIADETAQDVETVAGAGNLEVMLARLADSVGNLSPLLSATIIADGAAAPEITDVAMTSYKTVEVTFDSVITAAPANGFLISDDNNVTTGTAAAVSLALNDDGFTVATLTLKSAQQLATSDTTSFTAGDVEVTIVSNLVKADTGKYAVGTVAPAAGAPVAAGAATDIREAALDAVVPAFDSLAVAYSDVDGDADDDDAEITLTFTEQVAGALAAFDLVVKDADGEELVAGTDYTTTIVAGEVVILIEDLDDATGYTVASKATVNYIADAAGNKAAAFDAQDVE